MNCSQSAIGTANFRRSYSSKSHAHPRIYGTGTLVSSGIQDACCGYGGLESFGRLPVRVLAFRRGSGDPGWAGRPQFCTQHRFANWNVASHLINMERFMSPRKYACGAEMRNTDPWIIRVCRFSSGRSRLATGRPSELRHPSSPPQGASHAASAVRHCRFPLPVPNARSGRRLETGRLAATDALGQGRLRRKEPCRNTRGRKWSARSGRT